MTLMTVTDYAQSHGAKRQAADKWKAGGCLVMVDGKVDVEASDARMRARGQGRFRVTGHGGRRQQGVHGATDRPGLRKGQTPEQAVAKFVDSHALLSTEDALRLKENYLARHQQLSYDLKVGNVVLIDEVAARVGAEYAAVRKKLLAIPAERAAELARISHPAQVEDLLRTVITEALEALVSEGPQPAPEKKAA